jgi:hypothetical protein
MTVYAMGREPRGRSPSRWVIALELGLLLVLLALNG